MKKYFTVLMMILAVGMLSPTASAKKFGGGRSMGKTYKTAPAQPTSATNLTRSTAPKAGSSKSGMMKGLFGGLLAGGLLAALFGSGAFEGIQLMDVVLLALLAGGVWWFFKKRHQAMAKTTLARQPVAASGAAFEASHAGGSGSTWGGANAAAPSSDVPFVLLPDFNLPAFLNESRDHYRAVQKAWFEQDWRTLEEYIAPELIPALRQERAADTDTMAMQILFLDVECVRANQANHVAELSLCFKGRYQEASGEQALHEIWHLERSLDRPNAPWLIVGFEDK